MTIVYMNTPPWDQPKGHVASIPWDIMVPILRIPIVTGFYQQWLNSYELYDQLTIPPVGQSHY